MTKEAKPKRRKGGILPPLDNGASQIQALAEAMIPKGEDGELSDQQTEMLSALGLAADIGISYQVGPYVGTYQPVMIDTERDLFEFVLYALGAMPDQPERPTNITLIDLILQDVGTLCEGASIILLDHTTADFEANSTPHPFGTTRAEIAANLRKTRSVTMSQLVDLVAGTIKVQGLMANLGKALLLGVSGYALTGQEIPKTTTPQTEPLTSP